MDDVRSGRTALLLISGVVLAVVHWSTPAAAFHVKGINITVNSVDSVTRTATIDIAESTVGTGAAHTQATVQWGDAMTSGHAWTGNTTTGGGSKIYHVTGVAHVYPDLTDRTIRVISDCCGPTGFSPLTDTQPIQLGCADAPVLGCLTPTSAILQFKNNTTDDNKDQVQFKWLKGTSPGASTSAQYFFCLYAPGLVLEAVVPPGPNLTLTGSGILKYKDKTGAAGGITQIKVKPSAVGKGQVQVKGKGMNLQDPMPLTQPVTAQLQNSDGLCWGHQFTSPEKKNTLEQFKDKEP
jgi:hypothetical protein